jgi:hypothetical protein
VSDMSTTWMIELCPPNDAKSRGDYGVIVVCCCSMVHIKVLGCSQIIMFLVDCATMPFGFTSIYTHMCMIIANKGQPTG